ncbi:hypothetical protein ACJX0J_020823, partial [Zea mays]
MDRTWMIVGLVGSPRLPSSGIPREDDQYKKHLLHNYWHFGLQSNLNAIDVDILMILLIMIHSALVQSFDNVFASIIQYTTIQYTNTTLHHQYVICDHHYTTNIIQYTTIQYTNTTLHHQYVICDHLDPLQRYCLLARSMIQEEAQDTFIELGLLTFLRVFIYIFGLSIEGDINFLIIHELDGDHSVE